VHDRVPNDSVLRTLVGATQHSPKHAGAHDTDEIEPAVHVITLDRDAHIDILLASQLTAGVTQQLAQRYDLRLTLPNPDDATTWAGDVVLCARQGLTSLAWLANATRQARRRQQRVRAVVLWSRHAASV
jgi:hypothetical protein